MGLKLKHYDPLEHVRPYETTVQASYYPKVVNIDHVKQIHEQYKARGLIPEVLFDYELYKYVDNFTTLNHLKYGLFPQCLAKRRKQPQDMLINFGNLTQYGLKEQKKYDWSLDRQDPRNTLESEYKYVYVEHKIEPDLKPKCKPPVETCDVITWKCKNVPIQKAHTCIPEKIPRMEYRLKFLKDTLPQPKPRAEPCLNTHKYK